MKERIPKRRKISQAILQSLAAGVVPRIGIENIAVGRYGSGKSFMLQMLRNAAQQRKFVVADARAETEDLIVNMRQLSERKRQPDIYHVHHGSISAPLREAAEAAMKDKGQQACAAATITLELGIDLGLLDQVIQVNSTHSVSSFVQRLGRSGRRGGPARMFFYATEQVGQNSYPYLQARAKKRLQIARKAAQSIGLQDSSILPLAPNRFLVFPCCGSRQFSTQLLLLDLANIKVRSVYEPYYYEIVHEADNPDDLRLPFRRSYSTLPANSDLIGKIHEAALRRNKYDRYIPTDLLREAFAQDFVDIPGAIESINYL